MKPRLLIVAGAIAAVVLAGCSTGSSSSSTTSTTSATRAVCAARADLRSSVAALTSPALLTGGKAGIQSALAAVKTDLDAVASTAKSSYKPQVDAVQSAVSDLDQALGALGSGSVTGNLQAVGTAIADVGTTTAALVTALQTECPSGST